MMASMFSLSIGNLTFMTSMQMGISLRQYDGPSISHVPQFIYLTTGFHWEWDGVDRPGLFPNEARVDWVRVWKIEDEVGRGAEDRT